MRKWLGWVPSSKWFRAACVLALVSFGAMVLYEETRWNVITELRGLIGGGVVVWWILEHHSESVQHRAWLSRHPVAICSAVADIHGGASGRIYFLLGLPEDLSDSLISGPTLEERLLAASRARQLVENLSDSQIQYLAKTAPIIESGLDEVMRSYSRSQALIDRLINFHWNLRHYERSARLWIDIVASRGNPVSIDDHVRSAAILLGMAAIGLSEECARVVHDAGFLG